jgi:hypothetical protein
MDNFSCGYLVWWSIRSNVYDRPLLKTGALEEKLPGVLDDSLIGEDAVIAWSKATNLRDRGVAALEDDRDCTARYTTKDVKQKGTKEGSRILVRERVNNAHKVVSFEQIGVLSFDGGFKFYPDPDYQKYKDEVDIIVASMNNNYVNRIDQIDDDRIRHALLRWTEARNSIAVRKSGGVYYLPHYEGLGDEVIRIANWIKRYAIGDFTSVEIYESPGTNIDSLVSSATQELTEDAKVLESKIGELIAAYKDDMAAYAAGKMDVKIMTQKVGSYGYTIAMYQSSLNKLKEKVDAAEGSLGRTLGSLVGQLNIMVEKATHVKNRASSDLVKYREDLGTTKAAKQAAAKQAAPVKKNGKVKRQDV